MLEKNDITVLKNLIAETVDERMTKVEGRLAETEKRLEQKIEARVAETEKLVLEEVDWVQIYANKRFDRMQKDLDEMKSYYRTRRLDNDTIAIYMKSIPDLQRRVYRLEQMMMCSA